MSMWDLREWRPITCAERDDIARGPSATASCVLSSLTDLDGRFGEPLVYTEWGDADERPVLRDYRWPKDDERDCEHYVPAVSHKPDTVSRETSPIPGPV